MTTSKPMPFVLRSHPHLYEISTWAWLEKLSTCTGRFVKLGDIPDVEWDALARLGFNAIWLMGVWRRSPESRRLALADPANIPQFDRALPGWKPEDVVGSPYAVAEYVPDPRIGSWTELDSVREKLHARGMALFLDFVGNHTALDHPWTREHPDFYVQGTQANFDNDPSLFYRIETAKQPLFLAHGKDPYFPPWKDTAQLNHFSPQMRAAQLGTLRTISQHCDGVRCDMAMLHLNDIFEKNWGRFLKGTAVPATEFWTEAHAAVPDLVLLAEAYWGTERRLLDLGFSFVYDKELYDAVRDIVLPGVRSRLKDDLGYQNHLARFLENHDEARCASVFSAERLASAGTLMGTLPGMRLYHQGQLDGLKIHLPITLRMAADEPSDSQTAALFARILRVTAENVFHNGVWNLLGVTPEGDAPPDGLITYEWRSENSWRVISVNLTGQASQGRVHFEGHSLAAKEYVFYDQLNDVRYIRSRDELRGVGLFVRREAFQAHIFDVSPVPEA
ncbi:MAG TPA: alpha-amylase family glycosyl hydrolase [Candidatus Acidoferrales bacterium]